MANRTSDILDMGFNTTADTRGAASLNAWNASSISPGDLPTPPGFLTPEQVVEQAKAFQPAVKTFSAADFLTQPAQLADPRLGSRVFSSAPTTTPLSSPISVSAYSNAPIPGFLSNAINELNQTQSLRAAAQQDMRDRLLNAVLSGNYLAAEALRASVVNPGSAVSFGQYVQNPQEGQAAVINAQAESLKAKAVSDTLKGVPTYQESTLKNQLSRIEQQLSTVPPGFAFGDKRSSLKSQQFKIQQELDKLAKNKPSLNIVV